MLNDYKTRFRTDKEIQERKKNFFEIVDIFEKNKIHYFLQAGVVLGFYREKDFIKWDWDVEFGLFDHNFVNNYDLIRESLIKKDFKIFHEIKKKKDGKIDCFKGIDHKTTLFEILSWSHDTQKKIFHRWKINIPEKFLKETHKINYSNKEFICPGPIEDYLNYQYGDWRKPKISSKKEDYLTNNFFDKPNFFLKVYLNTKKIIKSFINKY